MSAAANIVGWLYVAVLVAMMASDVFQRRLPNWGIGLLVVLFVAAVLLGRAPTPLWSALAAGAIALAVGIGLYALGFVGAGDAKLFGAVGLFAGLAHLAPLALITALAGGALALVVIIARPKRTMQALTTRGRAEGKGKSVPYGVPISIAAIAVAWMSGLITWTA